MSFSSRLAYIKKHIEKDFNIDFYSICRESQNNGDIVLTFRRVERSDYYFSLWLFEDGDTHLYAEKGEYNFWYQIYEVIDNYKIDEVYNVIQLLLNKKSMIKVNKGFFFTSIELYYLDLNTWSSLGSSVYFRFGEFIFPNEKITYHSNPLL